MAQSKAPASRDLQRVELASDVSNVALCAENVRDSKTAAKSQPASVPTITVSGTDSDGTCKRFSTGSDYIDWSTRQPAANNPSNNVQKFFDGMGVDRSVMEPMLSIQYANVNPQSSSSLNLLESASTAG